MAKPEWGMKRTCTHCGARFYDLNKTPIVCPKCGAENEAEAPVKLRRKDSRVAKPAKQVAAPVEDEDVETEETEVEDDDDIIEDTTDLGEDDEDMAEVMDHMESEDDES